jgi:hypothetical protein
MCVAESESICHTSCQSGCGKTAGPRVIELPDRPIPELRQRYAGSQLDDRQRHRLLMARRFKIARRLHKTPAAGRAVADGPELAISPEGIATEP